MPKTIVIFWTLTLTSIFTLSVTAAPALSAECNRKPTTCMKVFIKDRDYESASRLYNNNQELFLTAREKRRRASQLQELADHLKNTFTPQVESLQYRFDALRFDGLNPSSWNSVASTMSAVRDFLKSYQGHSILQQEEYQLLSVIALTERLNAEQDRIDSQSQSAFLAYDHSQGDGFFDVYPIAVADNGVRKMIVRAAWPELQPVIKSMKQTDLLHLINAWTSRNPKKFGLLFGADIQHAVADSYYRKVIHQVLNQQEAIYEDFADSVKAANAIKLMPIQAPISKT